MDVGITALMCLGYCAAKIIEVLNSLIFSAKQNNYVCENISEHNSRMWDVSVSSVLD